MGNLNNLNNLGNLNNDNQRSFIQYNSVKRTKYNFCLNLNNLNNISNINNNNIKSEVKKNNNYNANKIKNLSNKLKKLKL